MTSKAIWSGIGFCRFVKHCACIVRIHPFFDTAATSFVACYFSHESLDAVIEICRNIQGKLNQITFADLPGATLLASFGIAVYSNQDNAAHLFIHADQALYQAKKTRNSIHVFQSPDSGPQSAAVIP
jgi:hypothetical protein